jgi:hypothetical protein
MQQIDLSEKNEIRKGNRSGELVMGKLTKSWNLETTDKMQFS